MARVRQNTRTQNTLLVILVVILVGLLGKAVWLNSQVEQVKPLRVSATKSRNHDEVFQQLISAPPDLAEIADGMNRTLLEADELNGQVVLNYRDLSEMTKWNLWEKVKRHERFDQLPELPMKSMEWMDLEQGRIRLEAFGIASGNLDKDNRPYFEFYTPELYQITPQTAAAIGFDNQPIAALDKKYCRPYQTTFIMDLEGVENPFINRVEVIDLQTGYRWENPRNHHHPGDGKYILDVVIPCVVPHPIAVEVTFSYGSFKQFEMKKGDTTTYRLPRGLLKQAMVYPVNRQPDPAYSFQKFPQKKTFELSGYAPKGSETFVAFQIYPHLMYGSHVIEALDKDGEVLDIVWLYSQEEMLYNTYKQPYNKIDSFRVKVRPHTTTFKMVLPRLPGLPEENENISDLLQATIPYVYLDSPWDSNRLLSDYLQMRSLYFYITPSAYSKKDYPKEYYDIQAGKLLYDQFRLLKADPKELEADLKVGRLKKRKKEEPGWLERVLRRFL